VEGGLLVSVRLTPKGGRDAIDGIERRADGSVVLKARVRPPAHDNAANDALSSLIAATLGVAASRVRLVSGATARNKTLRIEGDASALARALASAAAVEETAA
jgi:uncharacterized protein YggU (UPF0235/DUF167 family)